MSQSTDATATDTADTADTAARTVRRYTVRGARVLALGALGANPKVVAFGPSPRGPRVWIEQDVAPAGELSAVLALAVIHTGTDIPTGATHLASAVSRGRARHLYEVSVETAEQIAGRLGGGPATVVIDDDDDDPADVAVCSAARWGQALS